MDTYVIVLLGLGVGLAVVAAIVLAVFCWDKYTRRKKSMNNSYRDLQENLEFPPPLEPPHFDALDEHVSTISGSVAYPQEYFEDFTFMPVEMPLSSESFEHPRKSPRISHDSLGRRYQIPPMPAVMPKSPEHFEHPGRSPRISHDSLGRRYQMHPRPALSNSVRRPPPPPQIPSPAQSNHEKGYKYRVPQRFQVYKGASIRHTRKVKATKPTLRSQGFQYRLPQRFQMYRPSTPPTVRRPRPMTPARPARRYRVGRSRSRRADDDLSYTRRESDRNY